MIDACLNKIKDGETLSESDMAACIDALMTGTVDEDSAAVFLMALADRGETADEIAGAARALRAKAAMIDSPPNTIDCCGTGGKTR
jgi:anthranilate phosphoribosyltransferase